MNGRIKILTMTGVMAIGITTVILFGTKKEKLKIGSHLPEINFISKNYSGYIKIKNRPLMIMYFKADCPHCEYELSVFNKMSEEFKDIDVICITTENKFISNREYAKWANLANSNNFVFAAVNEDEYREKVGIQITPLFLFYGTDGILKAKIIGETRFDRILDSIVKAGVAQHR